MDWRSNVKKSGLKVLHNHDLSNQKENKLQITAAKGASSCWIVQHIQFFTVFPFCFCLINTDSKFCLCFCTLDVKFDKDQTVFFALIHCCSHDCLPQFMISFLSTNLILNFTTKIILKSFLLYFFYLHWLFCFARIPQLMKNTVYFIYNLLIVALISAYRTKSEAWHSFFFFVSLELALEDTWGPKREAGLHLSSRELFLGLQWSTAQSELLTDATWEHCRNPPAKNSALGATVLFLVPWDGF